MAKRYRLSLSLATKCRLGFAAAVLLIIGAALYVPFVWMDKLVEQGKRELALSEVRRVLVWQHFQKSTGLDARLEVFSLEPGPETRWFSAAELEHQPDQQNTQAERGKFSQEELFARWGMTWFQHHPDRQEFFDPRSERIETAKSNSAANRDRSLLSDIEAARPWARPDRYLRAVRADAGCLAAGCHGGGGESRGDRESQLGPPIFTQGELVGVMSVVLPAGQTNTTLLFNRILIIIAGLLAGICAVVTFYLITQRVILRPVRQLREAADRVSISLVESNDQEVPAETRGSWREAQEITQTIQTGDEFEQLAEAFRQMLSRLKLAHDRLRETNRALDSQLGELETTNIALYESNKLKNEFLANVSHELRTPLNAIIGFAEILKEQAQARQDKKGLRYVSNVLGSGELLLALINDLLDLAKIEAGKIECHLEQRLLSEIIERLVNFTRGLAQEKQLKISLSVDKEIGVIETDTGKLRQILFNLLSNAIKFTPQGGKVDVTAKRLSKQQFAVTVSDTGPGIAEKDREAIFDKFRQLDGSVTREHSGTGLGLTIVKELVTILSGTISVEAADSGGTAFTVTLPMKHSQGA